jgi:hypothetical protein
VVLQHRPHLSAHASATETVAVLTPGMRLRADLALPGARWSGEITLDGKKLALPA